jgi:hypothetical protein
MNKLLVGILVYFSFNVVEVFSQNKVDVQSCLLENYSKSEIENMTPEQLAFEEYYVRLGVQVYPAPEGKPEGTFERRKYTVSEDVCVYTLKNEIKSERVYFISKNNMLVTIFTKEEMKSRYENSK